MSGELFDAAVPFRMTFAGDEYQRARVVEVLDGDSARMSLDLGWDVTLTQILRVADLHCAEVRGGNAADKAAAAAARAAAADLLPAGSTVYVRTEKTRSGVERRTFGRLVAHVRYQLPTGAWRDFAARMRALGHDGQGAGLPAHDAHDGQDGAA